MSMGIVPFSFGHYMWNLPWVIHALLLMGAILYIVISFSKEKKIAETKITHDSVREALDNLPNGLSISDREGLPLLVNRRMYDLAQEVNGRFMQNAEVFWQSLVDFEGRDGIERIQNGHFPILRWPDGSVWRFYKTELLLSGHRYIQITATDVTSLHQVSTELSASNAALKKQQRRLKKLIEGMVEITREKEILAVKVHIHNELGRCVLAGRRSLEDPSGKGIEQAMTLWDDVANRLEISAVETTPTAGEALCQLTGLAALLGCAIEIEGEMPKNEDTAYLLLTAVREAVTNAVRHAGANRVKVELSQEENTIIAQISDDGLKCTAEIIEGSGLASLRNRILQAGGEMNILCNRGVSLHLRLP
jgi:signal transduction histidine kinase